MPSGPEIGEELKSRAERLSDDIKDTVETAKEWMKASLDEGGVEVLVDRLEGLGPVLRDLISIGRRLVLFFEPTFADAHYLTVMAKGEGMLRSVGPEREIMVYAMPLFIREEGEEAIGHLCAALYIKCGLAALWILSDLVASAASSESDLLIWQLRRECEGEA